MTAVPRIFLLSPAFCRGERAQMLLSPRAEFPLARRLRGPGAPLGEVFTFLSGLYFRGKLVYATRFARPGRRHDGTLVITPNRGLLVPETVVDRHDLEELALGNVDAADVGYRRALQRDARRLGRGGPCEVVLLGSVATGKYVDVLLDVLGDRLCFPGAFAGRGDMSRGGLLLRCARAGVELDYQPVRGARRHGPRPPRLT